MPGNPQVAQWRHHGRHGTRSSSGPRAPRLGGGEAGYAVNLRRVRELRPRDEGDDWEVRLEPPVNRVLPVARGELARLEAAFGDTRA